MTDKLSVQGTLKKEIQRQVTDYALDDDHVEAVPDYALDELYAKPEPDLIDFAQPDSRIGSRPGQGRDSKLFEYWGIPSYDEGEEDLKGMNQEESVRYINEILENVKRRSKR